MSRELLAHRVDGAGEPLLLLNGGMMSYAAWEPVAARLAQHYQVIRCDLRGQLLSPGSVPAELAGNVDDLTRLLDHLGFDGVHLLGTSYGGEVGLLMAADEPRRVRSLVAVTVADFATESIRGGVDELRQTVGDGSDPAGRELFYERLVATVYSPDFRRAHGEELAARGEQVTALPAAWYSDLEAMLAALGALDLRSRLAAIDCPVLVLAAALDEVIPVERCRAVAEAIPQARFRLHETSGHAVVAEDPEWLIRQALEFLAAQRDAG